MPDLVKVRTDESFISAVAVTVISVLKTVLDG